MTEAFDALYGVVNLFPSETGLPMTVWCRRTAGPGATSSPPQAHDHQSCRHSRGPPTPRLLSGILMPADPDAVFRWTKLNEAALVEFWNTRIGTIELVRRLQPLSAISQ